MATVACGAIPTGTSGTGKAWTELCKLKQYYTECMLNNMFFLDSLDLIQIHLSPNMI